MIAIGKRRFAQTVGEAVSTLFKAGGTADGLYHVKHNGIMFYTLSGQPFAFLVANQGQACFFVSVSKLPSGQALYLHSTSDADEKRLGVDSLGYGDKCDLAAALWEENRKQQKELAV